MSTIYRQSVRKSKKNRVLVTLLVLVCVMALALCTLTVFTVLQNQKYKDALSTVSQQSETIAQLQSDVKDADKASDAQSDKIAELEDRLDELEASNKEKDKQLEAKDETIKDLQKHTTTTTTTKPASTTLNQDLPVRYYGDYEGKKLVALTFDDGPGPYTERLLNEMKKRDVKATFFVLGNRVDKYPELIKRMEAEGHCVGSHSYDHSNLSKMSYSGVKNNMEKTATKIQKLLGHKPEIMRCPGGACNSTVKKYAKAAGIPIAYWSVDTRDWESRNVNAIMKVSFGSKGITNGSNVLMHDIHETSVDAAIKMMDRLIDEGYIFVTLPELIMAQDGEIVPGKVYY